MGVPVHQWSILVKAKNGLQPVTQDDRSRHRIGNLDYKLVLVDCAVLVLIDKKAAETDGVYSANCGSLRHQSRTLDILLRVIPVRDSGDVNSSDTRVRPREDERPAGDRLDSNHARWDGVASQTLANGIRTGVRMRQDERSVAPLGR